MKTKLVDLAVLILAAVLGFMCVVAPPHLISGGISRNYDAPLFPFVRTALENMTFLHSAAFLFCLGVVIGWVRPRMWLQGALATMMLFPVIIVAEVCVAPRSHNLWPIELAICGVLCLPALAGAVIARLIVWRSARRNSTNRS